MSEGFWFYAALIGWIISVSIFYRIADNAPIYDDMDVPSLEDEPDRKPYESDGPRQARQEADDYYRSRPAG